MTIIILYHVEEKKTLYKWKKKITYIYYYTADILKSQSYDDNAVMAQEKK